MGEDEGAGGRGDSPLALHAVVRSGWARRARGLLGGRREETGSVPVDGRVVPYRMVAAGEMAVAATDADAPPGGVGGDAAERIHERVVEDLLRRRAVVPLPYGCTAPGPGAVRRFLGRSGLPLREALDAVEDCYELRLHALALPDAAAWDGLFEGLAARARSARRLDPPAGARATAAFLLPRGEWIAFVEQISERESRDPGTSLDVTGPWAPYDFVRFAPAADGESGR